MPVAIKSDCRSASCRNGGRLQPEYPTVAKHEKIDDYIVCIFCNKQFDRKSLIKTGSPNPPKCLSYSARFQKKKR
jgi:hypothetical protein